MIFVIEKRQECSRKPRNPEDFAQGAWGRVHERRADPVGTEALSPLHVRPGFIEEELEGKAALEGLGPLRRVV